MAFMGLGLKTSVQLLGRTSPSGRPNSLRFWDYQTNPIFKDRFVRSLYYQKGLLSQLFEKAGGFLMSLPGKPFWEASVCS